MFVLSHFGFEVSSPSRAARLFLMTSHAFRMVTLAELPREWQARSSATALADVARRLDLASVEEHPVFLLPDLPWVLDYVRFTYSQPSTGHVGVVVQNRDKWASQSTPGALARLRRALAVGGTPGLENLGRVFLPPSVAPGSTGNGQNTGMEQ
jgi:hypothetical protein